MFNRVIELSIPETELCYKVAVCCQKQQHWLAVLKEKINDGAVAQWKPVARLFIEPELCTMPTGGRGPCSAAGGMRPPPVLVGLWWSEHVAVSWAWCVHNRVWWGVYVVSSCLCARRNFCCPHNSAALLFTTSSTVFLLVRKEIIKKGDFLYIAIMWENR